jgi:hypothetical protein
MPTMQQKRGTASRWTSTNPILLAGEMGFETDTKKIKIGDGATAWNSLAYVTTDTEQLAYKHTQNVALDEWHIIHNLSFKPNVVITDVNDVIIEAGVDYISNTEIKVTLNEPKIGYAYLS